MRPREGSGPLRILLVDDDPVIVHLLMELFKDPDPRRFALTWISDRDKAIDAMRSRGFDLCLLDHQLDGFTGLDVLAALPPGRKDPPVIMLTGSRDPSLATRALEAGVSDYVDKDEIRPGMLQRMVQYTLEKHEFERELRRSRDDLWMILDRLDLGAMLIEDSDSILFANGRSREILGISDPVGREWRNISPLEGPLAGPFLKVIASKTDSTARIPARFRNAAGRQVAAELDVQPHPSGTGHIVFIYDRSDVVVLRQMLDQRSHFQQLVGKSPSMQGMYDQIRQFSGVDWTVLLLGESGTGKELVARALHDLSPRSEHAFIPINCAGLTESLLTSQLFGHRKGAFTGAVDDHQGFFEAASGGTLFLDEIGDLPLDVQASLLRVLQEREIIRLGESKPRKVDARIIAATHRDLEAEVKRGRFRLDLLYRLKVGAIYLPPLRERLEDLPLLAGRFLDQARASLGREVGGFSREAMARLMAHDWPGNVRELKSVIEVAVLRTTGDRIEAVSLPLHAERLPPIRHESGPAQVMTPVSAAPLAPHRPLRERIIQALESTRGCRAEAARALGMSRATLYRKMAKYQIHFEE